jgi:hypothetical protein
MFISDKELLEAAIFAPAKGDVAVASVPESRSISGACPVMLES